VDEPWPTPEASTLERRTIKMAPPGWDAVNIGSTHPMPNHGDYMAGQERKIGAPLSMPLMIMRRDASNHNYSSARFDGQGWARFVQKLQNFLGGTPRSVGVLTRLFWMVIAEARFDDPALRNPSPDARVEWTHPVRPHVDPLKEAAGVGKMLETGQTNLFDVHAAQGHSLESSLNKDVQVRDMYEARDLPLPANLARPSAAKPDEDGGDDVPAGKKKEPVSG
ncbi:hypothetical protein LCGC14_1276300, partial [marine sediment metagenome]